MLNFTKLLAILALACMAFCPAHMAEAASANINKQELREAVREIIAENPELILDVLRDNSEFVLDVAQQGSDMRRLKILRAQWEQDITHPKSVKLDNRPNMGPAKAPVTITAFTDFTCLYCQQAEKTLNNIFNSYNGKVRIVYKSMPMKTHPGSMEAAEFMLAAWQQDQNKAWKLFDAFFANREKILSSEGQTFMRSAVLDSGLNIKKLVDDAKSAKIQKLLAEDDDDAKQLNITGTPCFLVNNIVIRGALQENLFRQAVDMALAEAAKK